MGRYVVRVVERDGVARFLVRGRLTDWSAKATHYPHPSNARRAAAAFAAKRPYLIGNSVVDVLDYNDPERGVVA